jgi:hypothetical protein
MNNLFCLVYFVTVGLKWSRHELKHAHTQKSRWPGLKERIRKKSYALFAFILHECLVLGFSGTPGRSWKEREREIGTLANECRTVHFPNARTLSSESCRFICFSRLYWWKWSEVYLRLRVLLRLLLPRTRKDVCTFHKSSDHSYICFQNASTLILHTLVY